MSDLRRVAGTIDQRTVARKRRVASESDAEFGVSTALSRARRRLARFVLLALTDCISVFGSAWLAVSIWALPIRHQPVELYLRLWPLLGLFVLAFAAEGLYPGFGLGAVEAIRRLSIGTISVFVALAAGSFMFRAPHEYSRVTFVLAGTLSLIAVPVARFAVLSWVHRRAEWGEPSVIVGTGDLARETVQLLAEARTLGYSPRWAVAESPRAAAEFEGLPVLPEVGGLERLSASGVRTVLVATDDEDWWSRVDELRNLFRNVIVIRSGKDIPLEGLQVRNLGGVLGIEFRNQQLRWRNRIVKRTMDVAISATALIVFAPLIVVAAALVRLSGPGSPLFAQIREGMGGSSLRVLKLRTMRADAEEQLVKHLASNPGARREWETSFKLDDDPRIIPVLGRILRRFSIDEFPQFWSVLRGDMSLVGPRPLPGYHLEVFDKAFRELRGSVRPGMTGLWQILVRHQGSLEQQVFYDSYYIRNWSIWMDFYILGRTVVAVLMGKGS